MTRDAQAMSKTSHKIHIALVTQPKNLDKKLRLTSPIVAKNDCPKGQGQLTLLSCNIADASR